MSTIRKKTEDLNNRNIEPTDLLNYGNISRALVGSRFAISRIQKPQIHAEAIAELETFAQNWLKKHFKTK